MSDRHVVHFQNFIFSYLLDDPINYIEEDFRAEPAQIQAESISWIYLDVGAYLHVGSDEPAI